MHSTFSMQTKGGSELQRLAPLQRKMGLRLSDLKQSWYLVQFPAVVAHLVRRGCVRGRTSARMSDLEIKQEVWETAVLF